MLDDDAVDRKALARALEGTEAISSVTAVGSVGEARPFIDQRECDIAFIDHNLPDGEGLALVPDAVAAGLSVLMVTGAGNERIAVMALNHGASDYLVKDVQGHYLRLLPTALQQVIGQRRMLRERNELLARVSDALETIRLMKNLVSICAQCKNVRVTDHKWEPIESYLSKKSDMQFSHGYCPECYEAVMREMSQD